MSEARKIKNIFWNTSFLLFSLYTEKGRRGNSVI